jgi:uncharacterized protein (TIGR02246 family)
MRQWIAGTVVTALCATASVFTAAADSSADGIAQDRMAIEATLQRYVRALDGSDIDAYLATLTDDARFVADEGSYAGKQAIRNYVEPVMKSRIARREKEGAAATATHHVVTNLSFEFTDRNNAIVRAYWMFVVAHGSGKPMTIDIMGSEEDYFTRKGNQWLIKERRVTNP